MKGLRWVRGLQLTLLFILLTGCYHPPYNNFRKNPPRFTHMFRETERSIIHNLGEFDVQYIKYGDTNILIVPTDHYFMNDSARLNELCYKGLYSITRLLKHYPCSTFYIAGFTDNVGTREHKKQLSQAQAETILTFLWANHVPACRLRAEGYGDHNSIANNHSIHGSALNRRVEIQWVSADPEGKNRCGKCEPEPDANMSMNMK
jgi:outer membrane protein OmpA-like peptidoglycan-associated protein